MKKSLDAFPSQMVWTTGAVMVAISAIPAIVGLVLKILGLMHGASLHTWLLDVGQNLGASGAMGAAGAAAAGKAGHKGSGKGEKGGGKGGSGKGPVDPRGPDYNNSNDPNPGNYTPARGTNPLDDPAFKQAQQQFLNHNPQSITSPTPTPNPVNTAYRALQNYLSQGQLGGK
jgi:hypothetical protein